MPSLGLAPVNRRIEFIGVSVAQSQSMAEARVELRGGRGDLGGGRGRR